MITKAKIKDIQSLRHKKFRDDTQSFVAEGPKVVGELLQSGLFEIREIFALPSWVESMKAHSELLKGGDVQIITPMELEKISSLTTPHEVVAVFAQKKEKELHHTTTGITLILDEIKDPGNLGTIIRTAHWFGVDQIICSTGTVDQYNPKVVQGTMASLGQVPLYYVHELGEWLSTGRSKPLLAATLEGSSLQECREMKNACLLIGNESAGISPALLALSDRQLTIPRVGNAESLNAAVACAILLYHLNNH